MIIVIFLCMIITLFLFRAFKYRSRLQFNESIPNLEKSLLVTPQRQFKSSDTLSYPLVIHQTYQNIGKIPSKVYENIKQFAPLHKHVVYDDLAAFTFLRENFSDKVTLTFKSLVLGAHKADLFRYAVLYILGGIYLDIKTELLEDVSKTFSVSGAHTIITVLSQKRAEIYQGVIAASPRQPIFLFLIDAILQSGPSPLYNRFCLDFYSYISSDVRHKPLEGESRGTRQSYVLYQEHCVGEVCSDGLDRYGFCCKIKDKNSMVRIKTRYADYPWL